MAQPNTAPLYLKTPRLSVTGTTMGPTVSLAANDFDGTSANNALVFTADATNGSFLQRLRLKAVGTNVATVLRIFINNGSANTTASNNDFFEEVALPVTTASATSSTAPPIDVFFNIALPPGFRLYAGLGTAVASGWQITPIAGDY